VRQVEVDAGDAVGVRRRGERGERRRGHVPHGHAAR
jgi:hypothetical protein